LRVSLRLPLHALAKHFHLARPPSLRVSFAPRVSTLLCRIPYCPPYTICLRTTRLQLWRVMSSDDDVLRLVSPHSHGSLSSVHGNHMAFLKWASVQLWRISIIPLMNVSSALPSAFAPTRPRNDRQCDSKGVPALPPSDAGPSHFTLPSHTVFDSCSLR
jgi:hypothetical protein